MIDFKEDEKVKKARLFLLKGKVGEIYTKYILKSQGYKTFNLNRANKKSPYLFYFLKDIKDRNKIIYLLNQNKGTPDFICKKGGKVVFVEVKTNNSFLSRKELEFFPKLKKEFPLFILDVKLDLELKDVEIINFNGDYLKKAEEKLKYYESRKKQKHLF